MTHKTIAPAPPQFLKNKHRAFTLIELLVVVLIIGILAAVALPQYTKSVEKSKASEAITNVRALGNALEMYVLENQAIPADLSELSVETPTSKAFTYGIGLDSTVNNYYYIFASRKDVAAIKVYHIIYFPLNNQFPEYNAKMLCEQNSGANDFCLTIGKNKETYKYASTAYATYIN